MELQKAVYDVRFTHDEIWDLVYIIETNLEENIKHHYNQLQQNQDGEQLFFKEEKDKLLLMQQMFGMILRIDTYQCYVNNYKKLFEEKRKERNGANK